MTDPLTSKEPRTIKLHDRAVLPVAKILVDLPTLTWLCACLPYRDRDTRVLRDIRDELDAGENAT